MLADSTVRKNTGWIMFDLVSSGRVIWMTFVSILFTASIFKICISNSSKFTLWIWYPRDIKSSPTKYLNTFCVSGILFDNKYSTLLLSSSKILNEAILKEAKKRGFKKIYLKTDLINYYEKFGAIYLEDLSNGEKLYYIDL